MLGYTAESLEIGDLPILEAMMRSTAVYALMRAALHRFRLRVGAWRPTPGSGLELLYRLVRVNAGPLVMVVVLAMICAVLFYMPAMFLQRVVRYIEVDPLRESKQWGLVFCAGLFVSNAVTYIRESQFAAAPLEAVLLTSMRCDSDWPAVGHRDDDAPGAHAPADEYDPLPEDARAQGRRLVLVLKLRHPRIWRRRLLPHRARLGQG